GGGDEGAMRERRGESALQSEPLRARTAPQGSVRFDVVAQLAVPSQGGQQLRPPDLGPEAPAEAPQPRAAQEPFDRVHLRGLEAHEVPPARQRLAQPGNGARRHMHDGAIDPAPQAVAELEGIPPVTLLRRPMRLEPHLAGIDHDRRAPRITNTLALLCTSN